MKKTISKVYTAENPEFLGWLQFQCPPLPTRTSPWSQLYLDPPSRPGGLLSHLVHHDQEGHSPGCYTRPGCRRWPVFSGNRSSLLPPETLGAVRAGSAWREGGEACPRQRNRKKGDTFLVRGCGLGLGLAPGGEEKHFLHLLSSALGPRAAGL